MSEDSLFARKLRAALGKAPEKAERFNIDDRLTVDLLTYTDRPYIGVDCIITNGVSAVLRDRDVEFMLVFDPLDLPKDEDLNAFMATYLELHFLEVTSEIVVGDFFRVPGRLLESFDFVGLYTTRPCYLHDDVLSDLSGTELLWLIPIFGTEFEFIKKYGCEAFENVLITLDPDLSKFRRNPIPLPT